MRTATRFFAVGAALAAAAPNAEPQQLDTLAAELPSLVSQLGPFVSAEATALVPILQNIGSVSIPGVPATAVVSDLPSILNAELPALETLAIGAIPSGLFSPAEMSAISSASPAVFTALAQNIDGLLAQLPQTLPVASLGGFIASNLPAVESAILADVSSLIPYASSILTAIDGQATATATTGGGSAGTTGAIGTGGVTPTATGISPTITPFTGAANANGWGKGVVGAAAVAVVGAFL